MAPATSVLHHPKSSRTTVIPVLGRARIIPVASIFSSRAPSRSDPFEGRKEVAFIVAPVRGDIGLFEYVCEVLSNRCKWTTGTKIGKEVWIARRKGRRVFAPGRVTGAARPRDRSKDQRTGAARAGGVCGAGLRAGTPAGDGGGAEVLSRAPCWVDCSLAISAASLSMLCRTTARPRDTAAS